MVGLNIESLKKNYFLNIKKTKLKFEAIQCVLYYAHDYSFPIKKKKKKVYKLYNRV